MQKTTSRLWIYDLLFIVVLLGAAALRLMGLDWDQSQHLHPDERFMTMVSTALAPVDSMGEFFDTAQSSLNPHNRGYTFYVYGTLPVFIVRYAAEWMSQVAVWAAGWVAENGTGGFTGQLMSAMSATTTWAGYDEITKVGRVFAALSDLGSIFFLYLIAARLYNRKVALLSATFAALAVMLIQQAHFYTTDSFANFFIFLATFFAVEVMAGEENTTGRGARSGLLLNSIGFGIALGAAVASKLNAAPLAVLLPVALVVRFFVERGRLSPETSQPDDEAATPVVARPTLSLESAMLFLIVGAVVSALAFRVFQPYAFSGPGFFGMVPNPQWVQNIADQRAQASGDVDFPPALQWARRPVWFSGYNLLAWGLGWPLGLLAVAGFLLMGWRILKGEWKTHLLLWGWTLVYFGWQSMQWNPTMRYQLPIYPLLAMMAAWVLVEAARWKFESKSNPSFTFNFKWVAVFIGLVVLASTAAWTYAYTRIYTRDHSRVQATRWIYQNVPGPINLKIQKADGSFYTQPLSVPQGMAIAPSSPYAMQFNAFTGGTMTQLTLGRAVDLLNSGNQALVLTISSEPGDNPEKVLATAQLTNDFSAKGDPRGESYTVTFDRPVAIEQGQSYWLQFMMTGGALRLSGSAPVHETSWDDGLPLRMDGYDAYGGMYQGDLNFEMYWDDNRDKLERFRTNLDAGDYIFITSNRQWATTTRIPERYPLTVAYYRNLIGCPADKDVIWCYNVAEPGMFKGNLGFELVKTFTSYPEIFGYQINTQFAEEAFTVYDAPKVLIFRKMPEYNSQAVYDILSAVDLSRVVHITPRQAGRYPGDLMLPADRLAAQRAGGTWSELFSYENVQNAYPAVGVLFWYLSIAVLGLFTWPILRLLLPGLADKGYPLARLAGLLFLAYFAWLVGSLGGSYSRGTIATGYGLIMAAGALAFFVRREQIAAELREKGKSFLVVEVLFLALFLIDLFIRLGNPDLWHPGHGGERPMDFSYLNAVLKSTSFPPYDPWYAGGYINYYYWGFVLVGTPIKMLGLVPSIAYNFVLPTLFALLGIGGFSVAWNFIGGLRSETSDDLLGDKRLWAGIAAIFGLVLVGNLGTVRMVYQALQRMVVPNETFQSPEIWNFQRLGWAIQGLGRLFSGESLPIGWGDWYWTPSRIMPYPDLAVTEFPLFTFLYSDLHAHMIAMPLTVLVIAWALSTLLARNLSRWQWLATLAFGGLVIGSLRPTNTWDFPTYLALGVIVTAYTVFRYVEVGDQPRFGLHPLVQRIFLALAAVAVLAGFALLFFQPYARWYGLGYSEVARWENEKAPIWSYWSHWGLFYFVLISWMAWETRQWLAQTPISSLAKLRPYTILIELALAGFVATLIGLQFFLNVPVAWFAFPIAGWALVLMLRPGQPDTKRLALFMVGTAIVLTLMVEIIVLVGDIGRLNTVFKFYLQAWILFAVSAAAALGWLLSEIDEWNPNLRNLWSTLGTLLFAGAFIFLFTAGMDKVRNRMAGGVPFTFDSITYMQYSTYSDSGQTMDLSYDYRAIRWMQDNIKGSPVIVEANSFDLYRWTSRYSIYTGLPGVVGWDWHQRQQRALFPGDWVSSRVREVIDFYNVLDPQLARSFLRKYEVQYIVVGQLERIYFPGGVNKFEEYNGTYWQEVYRDGDTVIYKVLP